MSDFGYSQLEPGDTASRYGTLAFMINQILGRVRTVCLVKVVAVNGGGSAPVGTVDVQPITNMTDGVGNSQQHGTVHGMPYFRVQGGANAIIVDPVVGDVGVAVIADRDISSNKANKGIANPGSNRRFDLADGIYLGGVLNGTPDQYLAFTADGLQLLDKNGNQLTQGPGGNNFTGPVTAAGGALDIAAGGKGFLGGQPAPGQITIGQPGGSYAPQTVSGDATLLPNGDMTVSGAGGVPFGPMASLGIGGGLSSSGNSLNVSLSGDGTVSGSTLTVTATDGVPFGAIATLGIGAGLSSAGGLLTTSAPFLVAKDYGAVGDGSTNDTAALQNWLDAVVAQKAIGVLNAGTFLTTATLNITGSATIIGVGRDVSIIQVSSTTLDGIDVSTPSRCSFQNFSVFGPSSGGVPTSTAGNLLELSASTSPDYNIGTVFRDVVFLFGYTQLNALNAVNFDIDDCVFNSAANIMLAVSNTVSPDSGDSVVHDSIFEGYSTSATVGILQASSGGLRVHNNKFINLSSGYVLQLASGVSTSELLLEDNDFDTVGTAVNLTKGAGTTFLNASIVGNNITGIINYGIADDTNTGWLAGLVATGNLIQVTGASAIGINLNIAQNMLVDGNVVLTTGGGQTAIAIGTSGTGATGKIGTNNWVQGPGASILNAASGVNAVSVTSPTATASPYTYTAGSTPETVYLAATTSIGTVTLGGTNINPASGFTTTFAATLDAFSQIIISYTGSLVVHVQHHP